MLLHFLCRIFMKLFLRLPFPKEAKLPLNVVVFLFIELFVIILPILYIFLINLIHITGLFD
jgi:hypothetical protein